jgi:2-dehydropantoate 2-reductase
MTDFPIAVIGAGAMGCRFGSQLFEAGYDVTLYDVWKEHVETIQKQGLKVKRGESEKRIPIKAYDNPCKLTQVYDVIFLFTKSQHTEDALRQYQKVISAKTHLVTLQNGIGNQEAISKYIDQDKIIVGTTTYSSDLHGPGFIEVGGSGEVLITQVQKGDTGMLEKVAEALNKASIQTRVSSNTILAIWEKLAFNAAINTVTAVTRLATGQVGNHLRGIELMRGIVEEVAQVAHHLDIPLDAENVMKKLKEVSHPDSAGDHLPSMLQDVLKKRRTEIDAINGAILREAEKFNINLPYNRTVYNLIRMTEDHYLQQETHRLRP